MECEPTQSNRYTRKARHITSLNRALVPEMSAIEWQEFIENVKKFGIRQPITINKDLTILDGRHRVRACKELGIERIAAIVNEMDEQQAVEYVRDTAIERRTLSIEQRLDIIFKCEDLMKDLVKGAEMRRNKGLEEGRKRKDRKDNVSGLWSQDYNQSKPKRTSEAIAEMVGTSPSSVGRFKKIRKESHARIHQRLVVSTDRGQRSDLHGWQPEKQKRSKNK